MTTLRVPGHGLQHEGRPVLLQGCCGYPDGANHRQRNAYDQHGHALCSCGETSEHHLTSADRQRWHRAHKTEVTTSREAAS